MRGNRSGLVVVLLAGSALLAGDATPELDDLHWMAGSWAGTAKDTEMEELWTAPRGGLMLGLHRDVFPSGNAFFEYLRVEATDDGVFYMASPRGAKATPFRLIEVGEGRAVFANPEHDYPQRIVYWLENERTLCAKIEGTENGETRSSRWCWQRVAAD